MFSSLRKIFNKMKLSTNQPDDYLRLEEKSTPRQKDTTLTIREEKRPAITDLSLNHLPIVMLRNDLHPFLDNKDFFNLSLTCKQQNKDTIQDFKIHNKYYNSNKQISDLSASHYRTYNRINITLAGTMVAITSLVGYGSYMVYQNNNNISRSQQNYNNAIYQQYICQSYEYHIDNGTVSTCPDFYEYENWSCSNLINFLNEYSHNYGIEWGSNCNNIQETICPNSTCIIPEGYLIAGGDPINHKPFLYAEISGEPDICKKNRHELDIARCSELPITKIPAILIVSSGVVLEVLLICELIYRMRTKKGIAKTIGELSSDKTFNQNLFDIYRHLPTDTRNDQTVKHGSILDIGELKKLNITVVQANLMFFSRTQSLKKIAKNQDPEITFSHRLELQA